MCRKTGSEFSLGKCSPSPPQPPNQPSPRTGSPTALPKETCNFQSNSHRNKKHIEFRLLANSSRRLVCTLVHTGTKRRIRPCSRRWLPAIFHSLARFSCGSQSIPPPQKPLRFNGLGTEASPGNTLADPCFKARTIWKGDVLRLSLSLRSRSPPARNAPRPVEQPRCESRSAVPARRIQPS